MNLVLNTFTFKFFLILSFYFYLALMLTKVYQDDENLNNAGKQ